MRIRDSYKEYRVSSPEELRQRWRELCEKNNGEAPVLALVKEPLEAYVNWGRFMADCPVCGSGIWASPRDNQGCCIETGMIFPITFPTFREVEQAETLLLRRKLKNQNWYPFQKVAIQHGRPRAETIEDLERENEEHILELIF